MTERTKNTKKAEKLEITEVEPIKIAFKAADFFGWEELELDVGATFWMSEFQAAIVAEGKVNVVGDEGFPYVTTPPG